MQKVANSPQNTTSVSSTVHIVNMTGNGKNVEVVQGINVPLYSAPSHLKNASYATIQRNTADSKLAVMDKSGLGCAQTGSRDSIAVNIDDSVNNRNMQIPPEEEREVEGQTKSLDAEKLMDQVATLKKEVEMVTKVLLTWDDC